MSPGPAWPPERLSINAWSGGPGGVSGPLGDNPVGWAAKTPVPSRKKYLLAKKAPDETDWTDPRVGWGLILPENENLSEADRAAGVDAPDAIRELLEARKGAPVFRYRADSPNRFGTIRRYFGDQPARDLDIAGSGHGVSPERIPRYLLIHGTPEEIPWDLQYALNAGYAVGRLHLAGPALSNYVTALLKGWARSAADPFRAVVWATDHGGGDMSATMKAYVATKVFDALAGDPDLKPNLVFLRREDGGPPAATGAKLAEELAGRKPGLIVTTSHGVTYPLDDPAAMAPNLGLPVDDNLEAVVAGTLLQNWEPDGAVWYSHACCSAGTRSTTVYEGLVPNSSDIGLVLNGVAALGSRVAPLPEALLGAAKPARAFVGHVEPTFDWTIRQPKTGQPLTAALVQALHDNLYQPVPWPVGLAFDPYFRAIGELSAQQVSLRQAYDRGEQVDEQLTAAQLSARDRMSTVILGDPTACFTFQPR